MTGYKRRDWQIGITCVFAVLVLVTSGMVYRTLVPRWRGTGQRTIKLPVPLGEFPMTVGAWIGADAEIPSTTKEYMRQNFADDFVSRRYANQTAGAWANVYVVYCASRPAGIEGHRPGVCYPSSGWVHDRTEPSEFTSVTGAKIPCLLQRFHRPLPNYQEVTVFSFYVVNGQIIAEEHAFAGGMGRNPNVSGDPAKYVAQVQVSSIYENAARRAAGDLTDLILDYLPDRNGVVKAAASQKKVAP